MVSKSRNRTVQAVHGQHEARQLSVYPRRQACRSARRAARCDTTAVSAASDRRSSSVVLEEADRSGDGCVAVAGIAVNDQVAAHGYNEVGRRYAGAASRQRPACRTATPEPGVRLPSVTSP